jgi:hypothetical protein
MAKLDDMIVRLTLRDEVTPALRKLSRRLWWHRFWFGFVPIWLSGFIAGVAAVALALLVMTALGYR